MTVTPLIRITIAIFLAALFLLRPNHLQDRGMWYVDDDYDYFANTSAMVFGQYPTYKKEFFTIMKDGPQSPIGTSLLAAPFVFVFSLFDRAAGSTITETRTQDNIVGSWSQFGFQFASIFYFVASCYFLFLGISLFVAPVHASSAVIMMVICQGLPLFVYRRPFFSHCSEFFLQSILMFFFLLHMNQKCQTSPIKKEIKKYPFVPSLTLVIALSGLIYLTRPNDIGFALAWPFLMIDYSKGTINILRQSYRGIFLFMGLILIFKIWPEAANHINPYSWANEYLGTPISFASFFQRIVHIFMGTDWGLIFTAPFLIISFLGIFLFRSSLLKRFVWLFIPMAINFYVIIVWGSQGGWYGYRYFIASAIPVMTLPLAFALEWMSKRIHQWVIPLITVLSFPPVLSMIAFEGCSYFNLKPLPVDFNRTDWTNPDLQTNIWVLLVHAPVAFCMIISQGMLALIFSLTGIAAPFMQTTWLRILIILILPWLMWWAAKRFFAGYQLRESKSIEHDQQRCHDDGIALKDSGKSK